jgi:hypothetical protein
VVDASTTSRWRKHGERSLVRVHHFATIGRADSARALTAELKLLVESGAFTRHAWVTLWDVRSTHQYVRLPADRMKDGERMAKQQGASVLGLDALEITAAVAEAEPSADAEQKRELTLFAAASEDLYAQLRPVQDAGFIVDGVCTPCGALWAQARLRRTAVPGAVHAYVALGARLSALVIVSNGFLLYAKEMHWGFAESPVGVPIVVGRDDLAARLGSELKRSFLYLKQFWEEDVSQVLLCGDMPEIRSLTAPLIERLNLEVETLDSLDGIDTAGLPEPAALFTEQVASLRLAAAIAAEPPPVNLLPVEITAERVSRTGRYVFAAGAAAAVAVGAFFYAQEGARQDNAHRAAIALQQQTTALQPRLRSASLVTSSGPGAQISRILDNVTQSTAREDAVRRVHIAAEPAGWRVSVLKAGPSGAETTSDFSVPK